MQKCRKITALLLSAALLLLSGSIGKEQVQADTSSALAVSYNADPYYAAYTSEVEDQAQSNYCWAYMANAVLESYLMKNNAVSQIDLAENDMVNQLSGGTYGFSNLVSGGNYHQAVAYWTRGIQYGPRLESEGRLTDYYVSETAELGRYDITDPRSKQSYIQSIKNLLVRYGAVGISVYFNENGREYMSNNGAYYYPQEESPGVNHGVTIVGWDDSFSAQSFNNLMTRRSARRIMVRSWSKTVGVRMMSAALAEIPAIIGFHTKIIFRMRLRLRMSCSDPDCMIIFTKRITADCMNLRPGPALASSISLALICSVCPALQLM